MSCINGNLYQVCFLDPYSPLRNIQLNFATVLEWRTSLTLLLLCSRRVFTMLEIKWLILVSVCWRSSSESKSHNKLRTPDFFFFFTNSHYIIDRNDHARQRFFHVFCFLYIFSVTGGAKKYSTLKLIHHRLSMPPSLWYPSSLLIENSPKSLRLSSRKLNEVFQSS